MSDLKTLEALNRDYISSVQNGDVRRFDEILAPEFYCSISGLEAHDVLIRLLGDVAIIHATTTYKRPDGQPGAGRYTDVWARQGGRWLAVSAHVTRG
jgi:hypothetical protein